MAISPNPRPICPNLGRINDKQTFSGFPSLANLCHHDNPPESVSKEHQAEFCLTSSFPHCPAYLENWFGHLPAKRQNLKKVKEIQKVSWMKPPRLNIGVTLVTLIVLIYAWFMLSGKNIGNINNPGFNSTFNAFMVASPTSRFSYPTLKPLPAYGRTMTPRSFRTSMAAISPTISRTQSPTTVPGFETPISSSLPFFIHEVLPGDTIYNLALTFNTRPDVITKANGISTTQLLFIGDNIVIPQGITDPSDLPHFVVYRVPWEGETITLIAGYYGADLGQIRYYNNLSEDPYLPEGRWLIIPLPLNPPSAPILAGTPSAGTTLSTLAYTP